MKKLKSTKRSTPTLLSKIKVQLDYKTIVYLNTMSSFKLWLKRFPNAKLIA